MFKSALISTIFATFAFQVAADPLYEHELSALPSDVAARVAELQIHGERFEPVIRAIIAEAAKPTWGFDDCGHDIAHIQAVAPQS